MIGDDGEELMIIIDNCKIRKIDFSSSFAIFLSPAKSQQFPSQGSYLAVSPADQGGSSLLACEECWPSSSSGMHQGRRSNEINGQGMLTKLSIAWAL